MARPLPRSCIQRLEDRCLLSEGTLDASFSSDGLGQTTFGGISGEVHDIGIQPWDGKIVVVGTTVGKFCNCVLDFSHEP